MELLDDISEKWAEKYKIPKPKLFVKIMSFNSKSLVNLNKFDYVINCSINKNYINKIYSIKMKNKNRNWQPRQK